MNRTNGIVDKDNAAKIIANKAAALRGWRACARKGSRWRDGHNTGVGEKEEEKSDVVPERCGGAAAHHTRAGKTNEKKISRWIGSANQSASSKNLDPSMRNEPREAKSNRDDVLLCCVRNRALVC